MGPDYEGSHIVDHLILHFTNVYQVLLDTCEYISEQWCDGCNFLFYWHQGSEDLGHIKIRSL